MNESKLSNISQPLHYHIDNNVGQRPRMKFLHDVLAMRDDGRDADVQVVGYLLVDESFGKKDGHLDLTGRKCSFMRQLHPTLVRRHTMWMPSPMYG